MALFRKILFLTVNVVLASLVMPTSTEKLVGRHADDLPIEDDVVVGADYDAGRPALRKFDEATLKKKRQAKDFSLKDVLMKGGKLSLGSPAKDFSLKDILMKDGQFNLESQQAKDFSLKDVLMKDGKLNLGNVTDDQIIFTHLRAIHEMVAKKRAGRKQRHAEDVQTA